MMKKKTSVQDKIENLKYIFFIFLKSLLYLLAFIILSYSVYKFFNWKKIFDRDFEVAQIIKRKIDLPPIVSNASSTRIMSYEDQIFLDSIIKKLKSQNIDITQIEEADNDVDVHLLTSAGYRLFLSYNIDQTLLFDNIVSVYSSKDFKSQLNTSSTLKSEATTTIAIPSNLEYIDFRFKDKVFYRFRDAKNYTPLSSSTKSTSTITTSSSTISQ